MYAHTHARTHHTHTHTHTHTWMPAKNHICRCFQVWFQSPTILIRERTSKLNLDGSDFQRVSNSCQLTALAAGRLAYRLLLSAVMPDCRGVGESRIYSKRAKKSPFAGFVPQSGITGWVWRSGDVSHQSTPSWRPRTSHHIAQVTQFEN